ncbi:hypothetical protein [Bacteroides sp. 224]|uniref:LexA family transcriptional regulator n=1 Tax=Bacteroides sp. 224 TaxID=2302936 RepID=UPI0013D892D4|nr:hypothetical protein [Bacteroides sp. 224]NDV65036.1 hypothetical protein [Bacteroides sp. 224]
MQPWERIQYIINELNLNRNSFSMAIGIGNNVTITRIINEKRKPSWSTIQKIAKRFPQYNLDWILTGTGDIHAKPGEIVPINLPTPTVQAPKLNGTQTIDAITNSAEEGELISVNSHGIKFYDLGNGSYRMNVPLVPYYAYGRFANESDKLEKNLDDWYTENFEVNQLARGNYLAFEIKGDSMDDQTRFGFEPGDKVLARELDSIYWKDGLRLNKYPFWVIVYENSVMIKQIIHQNMENGDITCHSLNNSPEYSDFVINLNQVRKLYNVIQKKPRAVNF